jgi:hypothetical protein
MDAELVIDHREIIMAHFTAASEMVNASGILTYIREDLSLTLGLGTWEGFHVSEVCQRCGLAEPPCQFYPIDELLLICLMLIASSLQRVVENDPDRMAVSRADTADPVSQIDPIDPTRPLHRTVMDGESHRVALP